MKALVEPSPNPMPGLGPSLLQQFLAEANLGTQPDLGLTEQEFMVQPLSPMWSGGRPEALIRQATLPLASGGKHDQFRNHFGPSVSHPLGLGSGTPGRTPASPAGHHPKREIQRDDPASPEARAGLAPAEQPVPGGGELAEWLSFINPPGGVELPRSEAVATPVHPGALEVAELVERWVRRMAVGGDQRRGVARLEIEQGRFSGAELVVVAEGGHVSVELNMPEGVADAGLSQRVRARLESRGYAAEVVVR